MSVLVTIDKDELLKELELSDLNEEQKEAIWLLMLDIFQTRLVEHLLSLLEKEADKRTFLVLLTQDDESELKRFLTDKINDLNDKIKLLISSVKNDLRQDVLSARQENQ